jgi:hypothetical protein
VAGYEFGVRQDDEPPCPTTLAFRSASSKPSYSAMLFV